MRREKIGEWGEKRSKNEARKDWRIRREEIEEWGERKLKNEARKDWRMRREDIGEWGENRLENEARRHWRMRREDAQGWREKQLSHHKIDERNDAIADGQGVQCFRSPMNRVCPWLDPIAWLVIGLKQRFSYVAFVICLNTAGDRAIMARKLESWVIFSRRECLVDWECIVIWNRDVTWLLAAIQFVWKSSVKTLIEYFEAIQASVT
jgi:hypothetical protein